MTTFKNIIDASIKAVTLSDQLPNTYIGLFEDADGNIIVSFSPSEINPSWEFRGQFINGKLDMN